jgi:hypothetical protein
MNSFHSGKKGFDANNKKKLNNLLNNFKLKDTKLPIHRTTNNDLEIFFYTSSLSNFNVVVVDFFSTIV